MTAAPVTPEKKRRGRGFGALSPERRREIASRGGKAAHESGNAHEYTSEEAREAGRKGGTACHAARRAAKKVAESAAKSGRKERGE